MLFYSCAMTDACYSIHIMTLYSAFISMLTIHISKMGFIPNDPGNVKYKQTHTHTEHDHLQPSVFPTCTHAFLYIHL